MAAASEWLMLAQALMAFLFVVGLIYLSAAAAKKWGLDKRMAGIKGEARMRMMETLYLDARNRVVLVRCDGSEYLLLLGATGNLVITARETFSGGGVAHEAA